MLSQLQRNFLPYLFLKLLYLLVQLQFVCELILALHYFPESEFVVLLRRQVHGPMQAHPRLNLSNAFDPEALLGRGLRLDPQPHVAAISKSVILGPVRYVYRHVQQFH